MCTFFLVVAFRDARFLSGLYGRFSYIVEDGRWETIKEDTCECALWSQETQPPCLFRVPNPPSYLAKGRW